MDDFPELRYDAVVVGGGAAGCMAAVCAAKNGANVAIVEKNMSIGRKLMITGKGRCNVTNACDLTELIENIPENGRFMYSALSDFSNYDIINWIESLGVKTVTERGNRVFPASQKAADIKEAILKELKRKRVKIYYSTSVTDVVRTEEGYAVKLSENEMVLHTPYVVLATGGKSYPLTGSTGDGYGFAEKLGHHVSGLLPGLVGLRTKESFVRELSGLTLKNVSVKLQKNGKTVYTDFGELLFTHTGVSGPVILSSSFELSKYGYKDIDLIIDLKPALTEVQLEDRIKRDFAKFERKIFRNSLSELLPSSLIPVFVRLSGIRGDKNVSEISNEEIQKMAELLKRFTLKIVDYTSFDEAIVTIGGVLSKEVNPKTMESKLCPGLYIVGELLNVTGYTGGFNLTIAFSTGHAAGEDIRNRIEEN